MSVQETVMGGGGERGSGDYGSSVSDVYIVTMGSGFSVKVFISKSASFTTTTVGLLLEIGQLHVRAKEFISG